MHTPSPENHQSSSDQANPWDNFRDQFLHDQFHLPITPDTTNTGPNINTPDAEINTNANPNIDPESPTQTPELQKSTQEILNSPAAKAILPHITLEHLSDDEQAKILNLASQAVTDFSSDKNQDPSRWRDCIYRYQGELSSFQTPSDTAMLKTDNSTADEKMSEINKLFSASLIFASSEVCSHHLSPLYANVTRTFEQDITYSRLSDSLFRFDIQPIKLSPDYSGDTDNSFTDRTFHISENTPRHQPRPFRCGQLKDNLELANFANYLDATGIADQFHDEIAIENSLNPNYLAPLNDILEHSSPIQQLHILDDIKHIAKRLTLKNNRFRLPNAYHTYQVLQSTLRNFLYDGKTIPAPLPSILALDIDNRITTGSISKKFYHDIITIAPDAEIAPSDDNGRICLSHLLYDHTFLQNPSTLFLIQTAHHPNIKPLISALLGLDLAAIPLEPQVNLLKFMTEANTDRFDKLCSVLKSVDESVRLKLAENFLATDFGTDFGDALLDIAGSEKINPAALEQILDQFTSCRQSAKSITNLYQDFEPITDSASPTNAAAAKPSTNSALSPETATAPTNFASQYARAANERLTDALTVFRQIAKQGTAHSNLGWAGDTTFDLDTALEALNYETKSLEIISGTVSDIKSQTPGAFAELVLAPSSNGNQRLNRSTYNLYSPNHGYCLLYTRPEGSHSFDPAVEYGKLSNRYNKNSRNGGVEASISFIVDPVAPFSLPNLFRPDPKTVKDPSSYDPTTMNKVSAIRLDREGRPYGAPADWEDRDPINPDGTISVDLAAINDRPDTPSGKIARLFSVGNALRASARTPRPLPSAPDNDFSSSTLPPSILNTSLNHNTNFFDQSKYGQDNTFADLVHYIDNFSLKLCADAPPSRTKSPSSIPDNNFSVSKEHPDSLLHAPNYTALFRIASRTQHLRRNKNY